jgi:hypothetical protein
MLHGFGWLSLDRSFGRGFFIWWRASRSSSAKLRLVFEQKVLSPVRLVGRPTDPVFDVYTVSMRRPYALSANKAVNEIKSCRSRRIMLRNGAINHPDRANYWLRRIAPAHPIPGLFVLFLSHATSLSRVRFESSRSRSVKLSKC